METFPIFNFQYPKEIEGINPKIFNPVETWKSKHEYEETLNKVANMFKDNFKKFDDDASDQVKSGGPHI
jgi:phosphoenolpyruvate carboxykinase (ATP)